MKAIDIIERLDGIPKGESDLVASIYEALSDVEEIDDPKNFFPLAFKYMRERDLANFGIPGPLSHLIEEYFPDYIGDLAESLKIKPTEPTLFLARRIFNSARIKKDKVSLEASPKLVEALLFAKDHLELDQNYIELIDEMISKSGC
jgi:hypothetical protein